MKQVSKTRWKLSLVLAAISMAAVLGLVFVRLWHRTEIVSKVTRGYGYRFTLPPGWKVAEDYSKDAPGNLDNCYLRPTPSPISEWISTYLFRQPLPTVNGETLRPWIHMVTITPQAQSRDFILQAGYPEPKKIVAMQMHPEQHLLIDSCPATVLYFKDPPMVGMNFRIIFLLVYQPSTQNIYVIEEFAAHRPSDPEDREMEEVVSSFQVEKVAAASKP